MIHLYKSFPEGSGNVGDKLIGESAEQILKKELDDEIVTHFEIDELINDKDALNSSKAIVIAAFSLSNKIWRPAVLEMLENDSIDTPIIPLGSAWGGGLPGDYEQITSSNYPNISGDAMKMYHLISNQDVGISSRDYYTQRVFKNIGIDTKMVGDCALYSFDHFGKEMHQPSTIDKIVVTDPHRIVHFHDQLLDITRMLSEMFPEAKKYFCFHSKPYRRRNAIKSKIKNNGFEVKNMSHNTNNLDFYDNSDLHVGYRLHGHVAFLRKRIPSILLCEDGRGLGQIQTFGSVGGFSPYRRRTIGLPFLNPLYEKIRPVPRLGRSIPHPTVPARQKDVVEEIKDFINQEINSGWRRYQHFPDIIESVYESEMSPFVKKIGEL